MYGRDKPIKVFLDGDHEVARSLIPFATKKLHAVRELASAAGVSTFSQTYTTDDGSVVLARVAGSTEGIFILSPGSSTTTAHHEHTSIAVPDWYSGIVSSGILDEETVPPTSGAPAYTVPVLRRFAPTLYTRKQFKLLEGEHKNKRLAQPPSLYLDELNNKSGSPFVFAQTVKLKASMYSGRMQAVVQLLLGYGKLADAQLGYPYLSPEQPPPEQQRFISEVSAKGVDVRYDYKFYLTHGITVASDGSLWLVAIDMVRGVYAMPLPYYKDTTASFFAGLFADDEEYQEVLEALGGLPTGRSFILNDVEKDIAAGTVIRLASAAELRDFYNKSPYGVNIGWCFDTDGGEAHNTCWEFGEDGFQRGYHYALRIKIRRSADQYSGTATMALQSQGIIYCPPAKRGSPARYTHFKYHDIMLGGLVSHEGAPSVEAAGRPAPKADAPMFVAFIGSQIHVARWFNDATFEPLQQVTGAPEPGECMYNNTWEITTYTAEGLVPRTMYTNVNDVRVALEASESVEKISITDLGFNPLAYSDMLACVTCATVWRDRRFYYVSKKTTNGSGTNTAHVVVPEGCRTAYYMAHGTGMSMITTLTVKHDVLLRDPNYGITYRDAYGRGGAWGGGCPAIPNMYQCGKKHKERRVVAMLRQELGACNDEWANKGPWLDMCQSIPEFQSPAPRSKEVVEWEHIPAQHRGTVTLYYPAAPSGRRYVDVVETGTVKDGRPASFYPRQGTIWATVSPSPYTGDYEQLHASHTCLGEDLVVFDSCVSIFGPEKMAFGESIIPLTTDRQYTFVGRYVSAKDADATFQARG